jgi:hypothetical protein
MRDNEILGMIILVAAVVFGFVFPSAAKWILLAVVLIGLQSWGRKFWKDWKWKKGEAERRRATAEDMYGDKLDDERVS